MTVETADYVNQLNGNLPAGGDSLSEGDNHLRLIKGAILASFPNIGGAVSATHTELNYVNGVTSAIQTQLEAKQDKDADLTAIAALSTTATGRSLLEIANAAAGRVILNAQQSNALLTALAGQTTANAKIQGYSGADACILYDFKDEDDMASNSASAVPSQQSVKAYVDANNGNVLELISEVTVTNVASIDFSLQQNLYISWIIVIENVVPSVGNTYMTIHPGYASGTVFVGDSVASYELTESGVQNWAVVGTGIGSSNPGTAGSQHGSAIIEISPITNFAATGFLCTSKSTWLDGSNHSQGMYAVHRYTGITPRSWDSVRFKWATGNFEASGTIKMYGVRKAG